MFQDLLIQIMCFHGGSATFTTPLNKRPALDLNSSLPRFERYLSEPHHGLSAESWIRGTGQRTAAHERAVAPGLQEVANLWSRNVQLDWLSFKPHPGPWFFA